MDLVARLENIPIFERLEPDMLLALADEMQYEIIPPDTRIVRQADLGATFYVLDYGEAVIHRVDEKGVQRPVGAISGGEHFGVTSLYLGEPRDATVTSISEMGLWSLRRQDLQTLIEEDPHLGRALVVPDEIAQKLAAPRYEWLQPGEFVATSCRRHWSTVASRLLLPTVLLVACLVGAALLYHQMGLPLRNASGLLIIVWFAMFIWHWFDWRNDYFAVTTRRITHRERVAFVYESRNEVPLDRVQNINLVSRGLGQILGYGNLTIETAADVGQMVFADIPNPGEVRDAIWDQIARAQATQRATQRHLIRQAMASHMDMDPGDTSAPVDLGQESPLELIEEPTNEVEPGVVLRVVDWLSTHEFIPRTRIETDESTTWRKHWLFLIGDVAVPTLVTLVAVVLAVLAFFGSPAILASYPAYPGIMLVVAVLAMAWLWWMYNDWGNDLYIVTDERIVDIEKRPLFFSEQHREASLGMIQNVSLNIPNISASLFNYGDVLVQTAGAGDFTFDRVANPRQVQTEIFRRMQRYREMQQERQDDHRRAELAEWFSVYKDLVEPGQEDPEPGQAADQTLDPDPSAAPDGTPPDID